MKNIHWILNVVLVLAATAGLRAQIISSSGTGGAYVISNYPGNFSGYYDGLPVIFRANHNNSGNATININGYSASPIVNTSGAQLNANDILLDQIVSLVFDMPNDRFQMISTSGNVGGGGGVGGSGTVGFVPKFTPDGSTLGNSLIFDNGSRVGIGTITPSALTKLHLVYDSGSQLIWGSSTTLYGSLEYAVGIAKIKALGANKLSLAAANGTDHLLINAAGNVGIGVAAPINVLDVASSTTKQRYAGQFHNAATTGPVNLLGAVFGYVDGNNFIGVTKNGAIFQAFNGAGTNIGVKGEAAAGTGTNIGGYFNATGGANAYAAIFENGNVGIGTSTPQTKIHLENGHIKSTQGTAPTLTTILGGGLSHTLNAGSTDVKGSISCAGAMPPSSISTVKVSFNSAYNIAPVVVATVGGTDAGIPQLGISIDGSSTLDFTISIRNNSGSGINNPRINYMVIE